MKKTYEGLEMEVIRFSTEDIITTSEATTNNNEQTQTQTSTQQQTATQDPTGTQGQTEAEDGIITIDGKQYKPTGTSIDYGGDGTQDPVYTLEDGSTYVYSNGKMIGVMISAGGM